MNLDAAISILLGYIGLVPKSEDNEGYQSAITAIRILEAVAKVDWARIKLYTEDWLEPHQEWEFFQDLKRLYKAALPDEPTPGLGKGKQ
jgi:alpha-amylase/alpha-mannosidase (GH57 family)